jgi:hypothetical protein
MQVLLAPPRLLAITVAALPARSRSAQVDRDHPVELLVWVVRERPEVVAAGDARAVDAEVEPTAVPGGDRHGLLHGGFCRAWHVHRASWLSESGRTVWT